MDRVIIYPDENILETDLLGTNVNVMIGLGYALKAILGSSTLVDGLACTPTAPASLQVQVAAGSIYSLQNVDTTAYSSIPADTTHQIVKQGISTDTVLLTCAAPGTTGQSINYLVEVAYQDADVNSVILPYYNSSNPAVAYSGPGGSGAANYVLRRGKCLVQVKAGTAATTGSQTTPAADAGYTGLWVVTVANGATTITSGNIVAASGAPFITDKLIDKLSQTTADARYLQKGSNLTDLGSLATSLATLGFGSASGYLKIPNAVDPTKPFIVQYGQNTISSGTSATFSLPLAFPNNHFTIVGSDIGASTVPMGIQKNSGTPLTSFDVNIPSAVTKTFNWISIGN